MADLKISQLTALATFANDDLLPIVDTSATETKKVEWGAIKTALAGVFWAYDGNTVGSEKFIGTIDAYDFPIRTTNIERMVVAAGGNVGIGVAVPTAKLHVVGSGTTSSTYSLFAENSGSTHSFGLRDDGKIYRNTFLYSMPADQFTVTTWGTNAGFTLGTASNSLNNTFIGYNAGYAIPNTAGEYNANVIIGAYSLTTLTTTLSVLIGNDAGGRLAGSYSSIQGGGQTFVGYAAGSYCTTGINNISIGPFSNAVGASYITTASYSIGIGAWSTTGNFSGVFGVGSSPATANNQIVFGGGIDTGTAFEYAYTDIYFGKGVTNGAPSAFTIHATSGSGSNVAGANLQYAIGQATGDAASGDHLWYYAPSGSSGTTLTTLTEAMRLKGTTGNLMLSASLLPATNDGAALGSATLSFSDLFLASGAVVNFANGNSVLTHSSGILTVSTGDLRVTTAGTDATSVVTLAGTQTLTNKSIVATQLTGTAYTMAVNNTSGTAPYTFANYQDEAIATYGGTFTWTGSASPTTIVSQQFKWQRIGSFVILTVSVLYTTPGTANTACIITLPATCPNPAVIANSGDAASEYMYPICGGRVETNQTANPSAVRGGIRRNSGDTAFEILTIFGSVNALHLQMTIIYPTA